MQHHYINNQNAPASNGQTLPMIDPATGEVYEQIARGTAQDVDSAVRAARACYGNVWQHVSAAERGRLLMKLSMKVAEHADELAAIEQRDCGKPVKQAKADSAALARYFEF